MKKINKDILAIKNIFKYIILLNLINFLMETDVIYIVNILKYHPTKYAPNQADLLYHSHFLPSLQIVNLSKE